MNIAEFFVLLGVKGSEKSVQALGGVKKGLGEVKSMSLEAKAGIVAVVYGLHSMMSNSAKAGTNLTNFAAVTGKSSETLQRYTYAAKQAGIANEETQASFSGLAQTVARMRMNEGAPTGLGLVARLTGGIDRKKMGDMDYMMQKLQDFAQKTKGINANEGNIALKSFGVSEGTIAAMRRGAFSKKNLDAAPVRSEGQLAQLDKANVAWANLGDKFGRIFDNFTAKHGASLVGDIAKIIPPLTKMMDQFMRMSEALGLFKQFGKVLEGWGMIFDSISGTMQLMNDAGSDDPEKNQSASDKVSGFFSDMALLYKDMKEVEQEQIQAGIKKRTAETEKNGLSLHPNWYGRRIQLIAPKGGGEGGPGKTAGTAPVIHQNIQHTGDAKDTAAVARTHKAAAAGANRAIRQSPQGRGS